MVVSAGTTSNAAMDDTVVLSRRQLSAVTKVGQLAASAGDRGGRAHAVIEEIAELVDCDAIGLSAWNPFKVGHEHVAQVGYSDDIVTYTNESRFLGDAAYRSVRASRRPRRMVDVPGIEQTDPFVRVFGPAGFSEGVITCLHASDGRYTGMLYLSTRRDIPASENAVTLLDLASRALAELTDVMHSLQTIADAFVPAAAAVVVIADGVIMPLPGRSPGRLLDEHSGIVAESIRRAPRDAGAVSFLWFEDGALLRVYAARVGSTPHLVVGAAPTSCALTIRELEVLTALATGATNPEIADRLVVSRHTVSRHIEHILEKLGVSTRAAAASVAVSDGLVLGGRAAKDRSSEG